MDTEAFGWPNLPTWLAVKKVESDTTMATSWRAAAVEAYRDRIALAAKHARDGGAPLSDEDCVLQYLALVYQDRYRNELPLNMHERDSEMLDYAVGFVHWTTIAKSFLEVAKQYDREHPEDDFAEDTFVEDRMRRRAESNYQGPWEPQKNFT